MDLPKIAARIANLDQLTLQDVQGDTFHPPSPEERAITGLDPKFKDYLREKLGLQPGEKIDYEQARQFLVQEGLSEIEASQYALFAME